MERLDSPVAAMPAARAGEGALHHRVEALEEVLGLSRDRLDPVALAEADRVLARVAARRRLSLDHTVVALAGATGSGKSTLFNALVGVELSRTGVRRPTTGTPVACAWDPEGAGPLLDRLGILPQNRFSRRGMAFDDGLDGPGLFGGSPYGRSTAPGEPEEYGLLDPMGRTGAYPGEADRAAPGLVLLDLPDHDSAAVQHRRQVDRLLELVDAVVWVVDPEKYADAALHERYLRPFAGHAEVTAVVLNQIDRLPGEVVDHVLDDLRRLLDEDGLALGEHGEPGAVVLAASALTGEGVGDVRAAIRQLAADRQAAGRRLAADVERAAVRLRPAYVGPGGAGPAPAARDAFLGRLAEAVGAEAAGQAAERQWTAAARRACGVARPRRGRGGPALADGPVPVAARPVVEEAVRALGEAASAGLPEPWAQAVREAARSGGRRLPEELDAAVARARREKVPAPRWWAVVGGIQWFLAVMALLGVAGLVAVVSGVRPGPAAMGLWGPVLLLVAGVVGSPLTALACALAGRGAGRRHGRSVEERLRWAAADCGRREVLEAVDCEVLRYCEVREKYGAAAGTSASSAASLSSAASPSSSASPGSASA